MPRGGRREGAGRKNQSGQPNKVSVTMTLRPHVVELLDQVAAERGKSRSEVAERIVKRSFGLPEEEEGDGQ